MTDQKHPEPAEIVRLIGAQIHQGNGRAELHKIVLGIAAFSLTALLGVAVWQFNRVIDKQEDLAQGQAETNERITKVETKVDILLQEQRQ